MTFKEILDGMDTDAVKRMARKVPQWAGVTGIEFPTRLSVEQCSSSETALYKAALASAIFQRKPGKATSCNNAAAKPVICDLTGGLGVDCWAFSGIASHVHHNEMDPGISASVRRNFSSLGISNASFSSIEITPGRVQEAIDACGELPDIIFLDPARRNGTGRKVFLLEDCSPDILTLRDELLGTAPDILVKLSPMADITMICRRLGPTVREVHVVESERECKELLVWMQRGWDRECGIIFKDLHFTLQEESGAVPVLLESADALKQAGALFEPSASMLKTGCFSLACGRFGLKKLGRFTHLYSAATASDDLKAYGKLFTIKEILPFDGRSIKAAGKSWPRCEITSRNLPISSEELRKKMGVTSGGDIHIFACTADFTQTGSQRILMVTSRI